MLVTSNAMLPTRANTPALGQSSLTHIDKYLTQTPFFGGEASAFEEVDNFYYLCFILKGTFSSFLSKQVKGEESSHKIGRESGSLQFQSQVFRLGFLTGIYKKFLTQ